ncbi:MAG: SDR family NAD(P)-dependent oxidoreductase [Vulcanimicrobiaceae bacterium]
MSKVWFITGSSRGFGRIWTEAALARGDKVAATARNTESLESLAGSHGKSVLPIQLDVTKKTEVDEAVRRVHETFGRIDVLVNNAGYGLFGTIEEVSEAQAREQIETNVFGALWVTKAVVPIMREQRSGRIVQISSVAGVLANANLGMYHASKWALEGFSQALAVEMREFGVKVTIVEPGGFTTEWGTTSAVWAEPLPAYEPIREAHAARRAKMRRGDPQATARVMFELVDMEEPPLRVVFGSGLVDALKTEYEKRVAVWEEYRRLAEESQGGELVS